MHQLTVGTRTEWDNFLCEVAMNEYLRIEGRGEPLAFEPFLFFEDTAPNSYDAAYQNLCRLSTLDRLVNIGGLITDEAIKLYNHTYEGDGSLFFVGEQLYRRNDHYHYTLLNTKETDAQELLDLICTEEIYTQEITDDGFRMTAHGFDHHVLDVVDKLNTLLYQTKVHLLTLNIPQEHSFCCNWRSVSDIQSQFEEVCDNDGDMITETYELDKFRKDGLPYEGIPCYVVVEHAYKGGGFSCIN